jgi:UDP-galactopyranose mutase
MDELTAFAGAPPELAQLENQLLASADVVFTGGQSLFEVKRHLHPLVYACPSSVDVAHFVKARNDVDEPGDQRDIPRVRLGYYGVIDERIDYTLLQGISALRPNWHIVLVGPTAKIDSAALPRAANIHYLGMKAYADLPRYLAGWDVAILPFARNDATRFISPTKTPEYLAGGKPVVSTSIRDVVHPYGREGLAHIADTPRDFVAMAEMALTEDTAARLRRADAFLAQTSWERTWQQMQHIVQDVAEKKQRTTPSALAAEAHIASESVSRV